MPKTINMVLDSSVICKWVNSVDEKYLDKADRLAIDAKNGKVRLFAPELAKYELGNVIWRKGLGLPAAQASLGTVYAGPVEFIPQDETQADRAMEIATEANMSFYDASFLSLADSLQASVVTDNYKHMARYKGVRVIGLKDY